MVHNAAFVLDLDQLLLEAIELKVSDIHFEPYETFFRIRFRLDGILSEKYKAPLSCAKKISARLKIMGNLDIAEQRLPQDGRFRFDLPSNQYIDFRISTCPTLYGEKVVLRLLDPTQATLGIQALGLLPTQAQCFEKNLEKPQGMILVTGPTGCGKSMTLYAALNKLNSSTRNISTCEDPVEMNLSGVNQLNIQPKIGLTFAKTLRAFLRQDPDIMMVGEIRDIETAEIAIKASQTGHMVLSTLHTNNALEAITRLVHMGIAEYHLASSLTLIIAQRLVRKLCARCKHLLQLPKETLVNFGFEIKALTSLTVFSPNVNGCHACTKGYKGRMGLFEILEITPTIIQAIQNRENISKISDLAKKEGFQPLKCSGLQAIANGDTSFEELNRVLTN